MNLRRIVLPLFILAVHTQADGADAGGSSCLVYTVQGNDTGYGIAKSFGLDFPMLNASNPQIEWEKIKIGEQVLIPSGYTTQPSKGVSPAPSCPTGAGVVPIPVVPSSSSAPTAASPSAPASASGPATVSPSASGPPSGASSAASVATSPAASAGHSGDPSAAPVAGPAAAGNDQPIVPSIDFAADSAEQATILTGKSYALVDLTNAGPTPAPSASSPAAVSSATQPTSSVKPAVGSAAGSAASSAAGSTAPAKHSSAASPATGAAGSASAGSSPTAATSVAGTGSIAAAPAAAAAAAAAAATSGCKAYVVVKGDTGYEVAQKHGVTMAQLQAQNPGIVWEKLQEDQLLVFPPTANGTDLIARDSCRPPNILLPPGGGAAGSSAAAPAAASGAASKPAGTAASGSAANSAATKPSASGAAPAAASGSSNARPAGLSSTGGAEPVSVLLYIIPASKSCAAAKYQDECATADVAAPHIVASFAQYGITTAGEQAALISWMIFESAGFVYNRNHFPEPGRPGQGTRTMMMPEFVAEYARSIAALKTEGVTDPDELLEMVMVDEYSFGSAAWFHSVKCDEKTKKGLAEGTLKGWEAWVTGCVGTEVGEEGPQGRRGIYDKTREALGVPLN